MKLLGVILICCGLLLQAAPATAQPAYCQKLAEMTFYANERLTQRIPWASLSRAQKRMYREMERKAADARRVAFRMVAQDRSALSRAILRDNQYLILNNDAAMVSSEASRRYGEVFMRRDANVQKACGFVPVWW